MFLVLTAADIRLKIRKKLSEMKKRVRKSTYYAFNKMIYVLLLDLGSGFEDSPHNDFNIWCYQYCVKKNEGTNKD